ncbi:MAG: glycoside hydrolase family 172 protein [Chthonomonadales bacterium]
MLKNLRLSLILTSIALLSITTLTPARAFDDQPKLGLEELSRLDTLPRFKKSVRVDSISSYDRTGGNDDGFSGKNSFVRKEGDGLVIADLKGPGVIYRIWTPTPTDDTMEFYFDGDVEPRLSMKYREIFDGAHAPFLAPFSSFGSGGFYTYLPLPYQKSCKIIIRAKVVQFYQVNYATYAEGTQVTTFTPNQPDLSGEPMRRAQRLFSKHGMDLTTDVVAEGTALHTTRTIRNITPGKPVMIFEANKGGRIAGIRFKPASAFAGKDRSMVLKIYWDGDKQPAVNSPAGDFFGYSWGEPAARSLVIGSDGGTAYSYFPMPFDKSARIELVSEKPGSAPVQVQAEIITADTPRRKDEGKFYAIWRQENPTTQGKPFNYVTTNGHGHLVGVTLQAQGSVPGITPFFEGDDQAWLDGELTIHGTGSEDFFNGGWYDVPGRWEARASYPVSGCLDYIRPMARSGAYRLFLTDAYAFHKSIKMDMEHAPERNDFVADYVGVSYLYLEDRPTTDWSIPAQPLRAVRDPKRLVFTPGWYIPIHSFSMERATVAKKNERIGRNDERFISVRATGEDVFGPHHISFLCSIPATGKYRVIIEPLNGPEGTRVQLFQNEHAVGKMVDTFAAARARGAGIDMGTLDLREGTNQVFFKIFGREGKPEKVGLDLVTLILEKVN